VKIRKTIPVCIGVFIGCQLTTGCETSHTQSPATSRSATSASAPAAATSSDKKMSAETVSFAANDKDQSKESSPTHAATPARLIGLFGEFENGASTSGGSPFDGGSNLAQITFATPGNGGCTDPDVDRTGTWLAFASTMHRNTADIYIKSVTGKTQTQITNDPADDVMPAFSPDAKTIAFASDRTGNWDIFTVSADGGSTVQITNDADHELHPTWSPDGKTIAYSKFGSQSQRWEIWTVDVSNPGVRNFLEYGLFPQWCPDPTRSKILFQRARQRGSRDYGIWTIDVVSGQAKFPTEIVSAANAALINPAWSSDGSRIVFVTVVDPTAASELRPSQSDLWVVNTDGGERTMLTNGQFANFQPVWATSGAVYFVSDRSGCDNIWAVSTSSFSPSVAPTQTVGATSESHP
jgi:TolB protein